MLARSQRNPGSRTRSAWRVLVPATVALAVACAVTLLANPREAQAAPIAPFAPVFHSQTNGAVAFYGNSVLTCPATAATCAAGREGASTDPKVTDNNYYKMTAIDVDDDSSTFNSSTADATVPDGSTIMFARLYWGGRLATGTGGAPARGSADSMKLKAPGGDYKTVTAERTDSGGAELNYAYQSSADVTSIVQDGGAGTYAGANVSAATGMDRYGGWSLVVAYSNPALPLRDLTVFSGFDSQRLGTTPDELPINGFVSPPSGPVHASVGVLAWEGDRGVGGDILKLNGQPLSDSLTPADNFFNSTVSSGGSPVGTRDPAYPNTMGFDIKDTDASGIIANGDTSATVTASTAVDAFLPGVITTAIDLYAPAFPAVTKSVEDLTPDTPAVPGDTLQYTLDYTNIGDDAADAVVAKDLVPPNTTYVPGSLKVTGGAGVGDKTDTTGDDQGEYDAGDNAVRVRLGSGATPSVGGSLVPGASAKATFRVTLDNAAAQSTVDNTATLNYRARTIGKSFVFTGNTVSTPVDASADLSLKKSISPAAPGAGEPATYTISVHNNGPSTAVGAVVTDPVPANQAIGTIDASSGTCTVDGQTVSCQLGDIASGATETVTIPVTFAADYNGTRGSNDASVLSPTYDPDPTNNVDTVTVSSSTAPKSDLSVVKTADKPTARPGDALTYTLTVHNTGPANAASVVVGDALPAGFLLSDIAAPGASCTRDPVVSCNLGTMAAGATRTVTIYGTVANSADGSIANTTSVVSASTDPSTDDNTSTVVTPVDVSGTADLNVDKSASAETAVVSSQITYVITVANHGPADATGVVLTDQLPTELTAISTDPSTGSYDETTGRWVIGSLANGASATLTVVARVDKAGNISNRASVTGQDQVDPDTTDDSFVVAVNASDPAGPAASPSPGESGSPSQGGGGTSSGSPNGSPSGSPSSPDAGATPGASPSTGGGAEPGAGGGSTTPVTSGTDATPGSSTPGGSATPGASTTPGVSTTTGAGSGAEGDTGTTSGAVPNPGASPAPGPVANDSAGPGGSGIGGLPITGRPLGAMVGIALLLIGGGTGMVLVSRRRRSH